ncbi:hypothetical protein ACFPN1_13350 [Lysobacter yangpyeongensis]|jgi:hypothetical protein|uniref:Uncharacterized protein n=1 Tax=Lysobacter yangpyeongensis TaxID=346182 RepID=A0ABW0SQV6_9GAMM
MRLNPYLITAGAMGLALAAVFAQARQAPPRPEAIDSHSADLVSPQLRRGLSLSKPLSPRADAVSVEDVGDVDSFGRNLRWLGVTQADIALTTDCSTWTGPGCQVITPGALTSFSFTDLGHIRLPPKASKSLLCYWLSPLVTVSYDNPGASMVNGLVRYSPTLTIENSVLDDPALINPMTGLPFAGRLDTSMTSSEFYEVPLPPGAAFTQRSRDSAVCIAGFLSKRTLVDSFGLTEAQANAFFQQETTVRLNVSGTINHVSDASLIFGLRIIGD